MLVAIQFNLVVRSTISSFSFSFLSAVSSSSSHRESFLALRSYNTPWDWIARLDASKRMYVVGKGASLKQTDYILLTIVTGRDSNRFTLYTYCVYRPIDNSFCFLYVFLKISPFYFCELFIIFYPLILEFVISFNWAFCIYTYISKQLKLFKSNNYLIYFWYVIDR